MGNFSPWLSRSSKYPCMNHVPKMPSSRMQHSAAREMRRSCTPSSVIEYTGGSSLKPGMCSTWPSGADVNHGRHRSRGGLCKCVAYLEDSELEAHQPHPAAVLTLIRVAHVGGWLTGVAADVLDGR